MKILLISNINMAPLARLLKPSEVSCGAYNSMLADLGAVDSAAGKDEFSHILCIYDSDTLMGEALHGAGGGQACEALLDALDGFCGRCPHKVVIANTLCLGSSRWLGFADVTHEASLKSAEAAFNTRLAAIARRRPNLLLLDIEMLFRRHGEDTLISNAFWYAGRIRFTGKMFELLAQTIRRAIAAHAQRSRAGPTAAQAQVVLGDLGTAFGLDLMQLADARALERMRELIAVALPVARAQDRAAG